MEDHLGVGCRLEDRAFANQFAPQRLRIGEIAIVRDGEAARVQLREERLHIAQHGLAGRGVAHMADGRGAGQALDRALLGKMVADESQSALAVKAAAVKGDDARRLLAAMLERMQAQRGDRRGVGEIEDAKDAAIFAKPVAVEIVDRVDLAG